MRRSVLPRVAAVVFALGLFSCGGGTTEPEPEPESESESVPLVGVTVEVSPSSDTIMVGQTVELLATVQGVPGSIFNQTVTWSSSDDLVATVSVGTAEGGWGGLVTGVEVGSATITATFFGVVTTFPDSITVRESGTASVVVDAQPN